MPKLSKTFLANFMTLLLLISFFPLRGLAQDAVSPFADLKTDHPLFPSISYLNEQKVVLGYPDQTFRPDQTINRAEFLKIIIAGQGLNPSLSEYKNCFPDVEEEWYAPFICFAYGKKWVDGYPDGQFKPTKNINKVEALKMLINANQIEVREKMAGEDWYQPFEDKSAELMLLNNIALNPNHLMTRAEISDSIVRTVIAHHYNQRFSSDLLAKFKTEVPKLSQLPYLGRKILMVIADEDYHDDEYNIPKKMFKDTGFTVDTASLTTGYKLSAKGKKNYAKFKLNDIKAEDYDAILFIGGPGVESYQDNEDYYNLALDAQSYDLLIGAICLAPKVLAPSGIFEGINVTAWDDKDEASKKIIEENDGIFTGKDVEVSNLLITANGPESSRKFASAILETLKN